MNITDPKNFGKAIRNRRRQLHYTQADIAAHSGLSISFLSDLENGKPTAELGKALRVVQLLGMDLCLEIRGQT